MVCTEDKCTNLGHAWTVIPNNPNLPISGSFHAMRACLCSPAHPLSPRRCTCGTFILVKGSTENVKHPIIGGGLTPCLQSEQDRQVWVELGLNMMTNESLGHTQWCVRKTNAPTLVMHGQSSPTIPTCQFLVGFMQCQPVFAPLHILSHLAAAHVALQCTGPCTKQLWGLCHAQSTRPSIVPGKNNVSVFVQILDGTTKRPVQLTNILDLGPNLLHLCREEIQPPVFTTWTCVPTT